MVSLGKGWRSPGRVALVMGGSGSLMALAHAPVGWWWLAYGAIAPLWAFCLGRGFSWERLKGNGGAAIAWGVGYYGVSLGWLTGIHPMTWMGVPWGASLAIAIACWALVTLWGSAMVGVWVVGLTLLHNGFQRLQTRFRSPKNPGEVMALGPDSPLVLLWAIALWCACEQLWSHSPLFWNSLAATQSPGNLALLQWVKLSGPSTITLFLLGGNWAIAQWLQGQPWFQKILGMRSPVQNHQRGQRWTFLKSRPRAGVTLIALGLLMAQGVGAVMVTPLIAPGDQTPIQVGIIQGNIPNEIKLYSAGWQKAIAGYGEGYSALAARGVDWVITPETALPFFWERMVSDRSDFYQRVQREKTPVVLGAFHLDGKQFTNSLFFIDDRGQAAARYDKYKLVPLGEYIPLAEVFGQFIRRLSPIKTVLVPGSDRQLIETDFGAIITAICYESAFSEHFRRQTHAGGQVIVTAANNAHYAASMPAQHHALDILRALETDRWLVRATNTGYSAVITPQGKTVWRSPLNQYAITEQTIFTRQTQTPYVRWGDWLSKVLWGGSAISLGAPGLGMKKGDR